MFESLLLFTCCMTTPVTSNQEDVYLDVRIQKNLQFKIHYEKSKFNDMLCPFAKSEVTLGLTFLRVTTQFCYDYLTRRASEF